MSRSVPGVVFVRDGGDLTDGWLTVAHEVVHSAGRDEAGARRYERERAKGAWSYTPPKRREPTAAERRKLSAAATDSVVPSKPS